MAIIRLHLLGFTPDLKGLVFSGKRGGRAGSYWVAVDDALARALTQLERAREEAKTSGNHKRKASSAATRKLTLDDFMQGRELTVTDTQDLPLPPAPPRIESKLSPREIQQMLREGRTVKEVATMAGVEQEWVERFLGPVQHEMAGIIQLTRQSLQSRPRLGESGLPIGEAVRRNLVDRRATSQTLETLDEGWDARRVRPRTWRVRLRFQHRGKKRSAEWEFRTDTRAARPRNEMATDIGWWPPPTTGKKAAKAAPAKPRTTKPKPKTAKPKPKTAKPKPKAKAKAAKGRAAASRSAASKSRGKGASRPASRRARGS